MRPHSLAFVVALAAVLGAGRVSADDRAIAEQAFQQGRELMAAGQVAEACPKFEAAAKLSPTAGVRLNLADCYARLGRTASAWARADEALALAERAGDVAAAELARSRMADLEPKLCYVTIVIGKTSVAPGTEVRLDGEAIPDAVWGTPLPVDPGEHEVAVTAPGRRSWSAKTAVTASGSRASVAVPALAEEHATTVPTRAGGLGTTEVLAIVSGGLGLTGLGIGAAFGLDAASKKSGYQQLQVGGRCTDETCVTLSKDAVSAATLSTVGFVVGGALAATGLVLWLVAPGRDAEGKTVALVPLAGARSAGAGLAGSW
jgi:hypothetical protein